MTDTDENTMTDYDIPDEYEEEFRAIAREEARKEASGGVLTMEFLDGHGDEWTVLDLIKTFPIGRRGAMKAMGLIAIGFSAPTAVLRVMAGTAEADRAADTSGATVAPTDDFVVPGTADIGTVSTDDVTIGDTALTSQTYTLSDDEAIETYANSGSYSFAWVIGGATAEYANFTMRFSDAKIIFLGGGMTDESNADLTGTTGTDGTLNISMNNATLHIENRTGSTKDVDVLAMGR